MKKVLFVFILSVFITSAYCQHRCYYLLPYPKQIKLTGAKRVEFGKLRIIGEPLLQQIAGIPDCKGRVLNVYITIDTVKLPLPESYHIDTGVKAVHITARDYRGAVWGIQTLRQLIGKSGQGHFIERVNISDAPVFPVRGFLHDTGRNFIEVAMLKRHIDLMSRYKLNTFQWHLTDNPAWRIESKVYPQLNDAKFHRKGRDVGRFYTYDEIRDVIEYARQRGVQVVPEIDIPGHSAYFRTTFGFTMESAEGRKVLEKCFGEFFREIPKELCPLIHIGSDEVHIDDSKGFMRWAQDMVSASGREVAVWDPGLPADDKSIRQKWNSAEISNAVAAGNKSRYWDSFVGYLNYYDPLVMTERILQHTPCGTGVSDSRALGGILCLWNDVRVADKTKIELHNGMLPGMLAFSERFWAGGKINCGKHQNLLPAPDTPEGLYLSRMHSLIAWQRDNMLRNEPFFWVASANIPWHIKLDGNENDFTLWGGAIEMDSFITSYGLPQSETIDAYAATEIYVARDTVVTAWVGFEAPARSNRISGGIGEQGKWENNGRLTVNGLEIKPAQMWAEPDKYKFHFNTWHKPEEELSYTDEQFYWLRCPVSVSLRKGWNKVEMYIPKTFGGQRWTFAFVPLTLGADGRVSEATGLSYR